jgi:hypothetical protein
VVTEVSTGFCNVEEKLFGPVHEYEIPPVALRFRVVPEQTGPLLEARGIGNEFTVKFIDVSAEHVFTSVTVTVYVPEFAVVVFEIEGFCAVDVNPEGPLHEYEVPPPDVRLRVAPVHTGLLLEIVGVGNGLITTVVESFGLVWEPIVMDSV